MLSAIRPVLLAAACATGCAGQQPPRPCSPSAAPAECSYLTDVHRLLHAPYKRCVEQLPESGPLGDPALAVVIELAVNTDGSLALADVIRSSGRAEFDLGNLLDTLETKQINHFEALALTGPPALVHVHHTLVVGKWLVMHLAG
jgi:hypothetical protein